MKPNQVSQSQVELWLNDPVTKCFQHYCAEWALHLWDNIPRAFEGTLSRDEALRCTHTDLGQRQALTMMADLTKFLNDFDAIKGEAE